MKASKISSSHHHQYQGQLSAVNSSRSRSHQHKPPGTPKKTKVTTAIEPTRRSQRIAQQVTKRSTGGSTPTSSTVRKGNTSGATPIFRGFHPDYVNPDEATLADIDTSDEDEDDNINTYDSYDLIASAIQDTQGDPKTLREAQSRADWPLWKEAMDREIATLERAGTWTTVPRPPGKNIVGSKIATVSRMRGSGGFRSARKSRRWDAKATALLAEITIVTRNFFHPLRGSILVCLASCFFVSLCFQARDYHVMFLSLDVFCYLTKVSVSRLRRPTVRHKSVRDGHTLGSESSTFRPRNAHSITVHRTIRMPLYFPFFFSLSSLPSTLNKL